MLSYMAEDSHTNGDYGASVRYCAEGLKLAREQGSKTYEADFHVTWAKNLMIMAQHGEAFRHFDRSKRRQTRTQTIMRGTSFSIPSA